jgi:beta-phosphoglucomutase-like phosphatase (HAD superfamily)
MNQAGPFSGLIFDFNGVLWWDESLQQRSWRAFAAQLRPAPLTDEELAIHIHGRNGPYTLEYLLGRPLANGEAAALIEQKEALYRQMCLDLGPAFALSPGALELFKFLVARRIPHTIATASGKKNVDFFIEHLHLDTWFDVRQIVYDDGTRPGKPAPDLYLLAADQLGVPPSQCVVVEDSVSGLQAAHAAGIGCVIALGPAATHNRLRQLPGVDEVIENLAQIRRNELFGA